MRRVFVGDLAEGPEQARIVAAGRVGRVRSTSVDKDEHVVRPADAIWQRRRQPLRIAGAGGQAGVDVVDRAQKHRTGLDERGVAREVDRVRPILRAAPNRARPGVRDGVGHRGRVAAIDAGRDIDGRHLQVGPRAGDACGGEGDIVQRCRVVLQAADDNHVAAAGGRVQHHRLRAGVVLAGGQVGNPVVVAELPVIRAGCRKAWAVG